MRRLLMVSGCVAGLGAVSAWVRAYDRRRTASRAPVHTIGTLGYVSVVSSPVVGRGTYWPSVNDWTLWERELAPPALNR